jgi:hypothetical protein
LKDETCFHGSGIQYVILSFVNNLGFGSSSAQEWDLDINSRSWTAGAPNPVKYLELALLHSCLLVFNSGFQIMKHIIFSSSECGVCFLDCRGEFRLSYFQDGILSSAFMVGLLAASPIFAHLSKT